MSAPVVPRYGESSLSEVLPSVASAVGVSGLPNTLGLPGDRGYVVMLIDALGWEILTRFRDHAPYLAGLLDRRLTVGAPATTATSLTSLGTGLAPGAHGIAGYRFRLPETGEILSPLSWESDADPRVVQPCPTVFEQARAADVMSAVVAPARFERSGLTAVALRGAPFLGLVDEEDAAERTARVRGALAAGARLVYCYERMLDHTGHAKGIADPHFVARLRMIDEACEDLRAGLPDDVRLLFTGDHGMLDIPADRRIGLEDFPVLTKGVSRVAGEGRFRHLYCDDADAVAGRWRDHLGERAWVRTRGQARAEGWFGDVAAERAGRFGDVVVAMRDDWAVMTHELPREWNLVGMHGSLTATEMFVPLLVD